MNRTKVIRHAMRLALGLAVRDYEHNGKPNNTALHDLGAASASLSYEAAARGLACEILRPGSRGAAWLEPLLHRLVELLGEQARDARTVGVGGLGEDEIVLVADYVANMRGEDVPGPRGQEGEIIPAWPKRPTGQPAEDAKSGDEAAVADAPEAAGGDCPGNETAG